MSRSLCYCLFGYVGASLPQAARTLTKALTIKGASPLLPAAEVGKTPTAAENLAEPAPKIFRRCSPLRLPMTPYSAFY